MAHNCLPLAIVGTDPVSPTAERELYGIAGQLRLALGQKYAAKHGAFAKKDYRFLWATDFPMFEWDETEKTWNAAHHPFTSPHDEDMDKLESDPGAVRALAYDVVLNGTELGSGSIRIHRQDIQSIIFKALGMSPEEWVPHPFRRLLAKRVGDSIHRKSNHRTIPSRPRPRPHRDDPRQGHQPARSHPFSQDSQSHRHDDGCADSRE